MKTFYSIKSKYHAKELTFRTLYPTSEIETHAGNWQALRESNVVAKELLGYVAGYKPKRTSMYWIVARS